LVPEKIQAVLAELERRLLALHGSKAPAFKLALVIHGEGGIPRRVEWDEKGRKQ